jgi:hypothetical protein
LYCSSCALICVERLELLLINGIAKAIHAASLILPSQSTSTGALQ